MQNCTLGEFPPKYLGILVSDNHLAAGVFNPILQGEYCMGFYLLHDGDHKKMDTIRANFLWQEAE